MAFDNIIYVILHISNNLRTFETVQPIESSEGAIIPYEFIGLGLLLGLFLFSVFIKMIKDKLSC